MSDPSAPGPDGAAAEPLPMVRTLSVGAGIGVEAIAPAPSLVAAMEDLAREPALIPAPADEKPTNSLVCPLLTDLYQVWTGVACVRGGGARGADG